MRVKDRATTLPCEMGDATAVYPGTFDPITNGHLDILARAASVFPRVVLAVAGNAGKQPMFSLDQRVALCRQAVAETGLDGIEVRPFDGLLVRFARSCGAGAIVRGLRATSDFEYEFQLALTNRMLEPEVESVFFMTSKQYVFLSSSSAKEIARHGGDVRRFVPDCVAEAMIEFTG